MEKKLGFKPTTTELTDSERQKTLRDLNFIKRITERARIRDCRVVISGGYANDAALGQVTRPHGDIDIQVYGMVSNAKVIINDLVEESGNNLNGLSVEDKGRETYYHIFKVRADGFGADVYYIQLVSDPFSTHKVVLKSDGTQNEKQYFNTSYVTLEGVDFEAVNPDEGLQDIVGKRERGYGTKEKHDQDIINLSKLLQIK